MAATPRYYPAEDAPKGKAKAAIKHNVSCYRLFCGGCEPPVLVCGEIVSDNFISLESV